MTGHRMLPLALSVIVIVLAGAGFALYERQYGPRIVERGEVVNIEKVSVFFPDGSGRLARKEVGVQRNPSDKVRADALLRELKEAGCVPDRLKLYEIALGKDGVLYLNVSKEFVDPDTPEREITMTYGLVDSFIESFPGAQSVQILVEGQPVYTRSGVLYLMKPLRFNAELLEE